MTLLVSKILLGYEEALWPKKLEISHASQILTNDCQILILSKFYLTTVSSFQILQLDINRLQRP